MAKDWDIIITNKSNLLSIDLQEIWHYRDLLSMYVKRDIITFYEQTMLDLLWFFIQPLFTTIMFVFSGIAGISIFMTIFVLTWCEKWCIHIKSIPLIMPLDEYQKNPHIGNIHACYRRLMNDLLFIR